MITGETRRRMLPGRYSVALAAIALAATASHATGATWGTATELSGKPGFNAGGYASAASLSCPTARNCTAVGWDENSSHVNVPFVARSTNGTWGKAEPQPGLAALYAGKGALPASVSCPSAGNCATGGTYSLRIDQSQLYVASEKNGTWSSAEELPGIAALNKGLNASLQQVSCGAPGNCSAGGWYTDSSGHQQAFTASERDGTWHAAAEVPGTAAINQGKLASAAIDGLSCPSAGNCSAVGTYTVSDGDTPGFLVTETDGHWGTAEQVPGAASLNGNGPLAFTSVSCSSPGNCAAGGYDETPFPVGNGTTWQAFVISQVNGTWGDPLTVTGTSAFNQGGNAAVRSVSCGSNGACAAGGYETDSSGQAQPFVMRESHGSWGPAEEVPGIAALGTSGYVYSVSCARAGTCSAGGTYGYGSKSDSSAFVTSGSGGSWQTAQEVPGIAALNRGGLAWISTVSCPSAGHCTAGGSYQNADSAQEPFTASQG